MEAKLIKIDRNGSKHYEGMVTCDRCGGAGYYAIGILNNRPVLSPLDGGVCWKCGGKGKVLSKWIERTPEYQAKLDAKRKAKQEAKQAEWEAKQAELDRIRKEVEEKAEAERLAEEARIKAQKAISQYVGQIGDKIDTVAIYDHSAYFTFKLGGWMEQTMYIHTFKDSAGNVLVWKTSSNSLPELNEGDRVQIRGTVKEHSVYKDEKQTVLTRCKVNAIGVEEA